jgi:aryl-alcohol dehydrogenase-like predicted oxidoreductase
MLTGAFKNGVKDTGGWDFRQSMAPRFAGEAFANNLALVQEIEAVATSLGATPGQIALAWALQRADNIVAIPGTTKIANLKSNLAAADVKLTPDAVKRLDALAAKVKGERYNEDGMRTVNA